MEVDDVEHMLTIKETILDFISKNNEAHFKSQQINEPDLSILEKKEIAENILNKNPAQFLDRFGRYLQKRHLEYFYLLNSDSYELNYYLGELESNFNSTSKSKIRNRRLEALRRLTVEGDYFSDEEMRKRNPLMYEQLIGQYLTDDEREKFEKPESTTFSGLLFEAIDQKDIEERLKAEKERESEVVDEDSIESLEDIAMNKNIHPTTLWGEYSDKPVKIKRKEKEKNDHKNITDHEKLIMRNEFRSHVYSEFLRGNDKEFDYSAIDTNNEFDDLDMLECDMHDKYFDSESPEIITKEDDSNDSSYAGNRPWNPPKTLTEKMADLGK